MGMLKDVVQNFARRRGYKIEKIRGAVEHPIDVFGLLVEELVRRNGPDLCFVQIGANDGVRADPLRPFVTKYRWRGVLVEPQPKVFRSLRENYADQPQLQFENAVVAKTDGSATLYRLRDDPSVPSSATGLASLDRASILSHASQIPNIAQLIESISVPALTFATLLKKHDLEGFDILQIDTEGFDFEVIKMVDFARFQPSLIQYEHFHLTMDDQLACRRFLIDKGYRLSSAFGDTMASLSRD